MADNDTQESFAPNRFLLALLGLVVVAMPTQYGQTVRRLTSSGGTAFERTISVGDATLALAFVLWAVWALTGGRWRRIRWPALSCVALVAVAALSGLHSQLLADEIVSAGSLLRAVAHSLMLRTSVKEWIQLVIYVLFAYTLFANLLRETRFVRGSLYLLCGVATVAIVLGWKDYLLAPEARLVRAGVGQNAYLFGSQNIYSGFLAMLFPVMVALLLTTRCWGVRLWLGACLVAGSVTLLGAGGLLAVFLFLPLWSFRFGRNVGWSAVAAAALLLTGLVAGHTRTYRQGIRSLLTLHDPDHDVKKQYVEWQAGLDMLEDNFLLGAGTGLYQTNIGAYYGALPNKEKMPWDSNNLYLVLGSTMGIVGLAAFLFLLLEPLLLARRRLASVPPETRTLLLGLSGAVLAFALVSVFNSLWARGTAPVLIYLITMIVALSETGSVPDSNPGGNS